MEEEIIGEPGEATEPARQTDALEKMFGRRSREGMVLGMNVKLEVST